MNPECPYHVGVWAMKSHSQPQTARVRTTHARPMQFTLELDGGNQVFADARSNVCSIKVTHVL